MRRAGQWLRFLGLLIEMVGVLGVLRERGGHAAPQITLPGGKVTSAAWIAIILGFTLWLVGKVLISAQRPPRRTS